MVLEIHSPVLGIPFTLASAEDCPGLQPRQGKDQTGGRGEKERAVSLTQDFTTSPLAKTTPETHLPVT